MVLLVKNVVPTLSPIHCFINDILNDEALIKPKPAKRGVSVNLRESMNSVAYIHKINHVCSKFTIHYHVPSERLLHS